MNSVLCEAVLLHQDSLKVLCVTARLHPLLSSDVLNLNFRVLNNVHLNLAAIEKSLLTVQHDFHKINTTLLEPRSPMTDMVRNNMMEGYAFIDDLLSRGIELYEPGNASRLLELNALVLCGSNAQVRRENQQHIRATHDHFYERQSGDIEDLLAWFHSHSDLSIWRQVAITYILILSQPQLYIEGNHRTGSLIMSYMLAKEGKPPFVLSIDNAKAFFDPSTLAKETHKKGMTSLFKIPKLKVRFAKFLKKNSQAGYILKS